MKSLVLGVLLLGGGIMAGALNFHIKAGEADVYTLVEAQNSGNAGILLNAGDAVAKYIPQGFQSEVNAFLIRNPLGQGPNQKPVNILIDAGMGAGVPEALKEIGVSPDDISVVLITHTHGDHIAGLVSGGKKAFPNAALIMSEEDWDASKSSPQVAELKKLYGASLKFIKPLALDRLANYITDYEIIPGIIAIESYGHTPGHTSFLLNSPGGGRILFWGDLMHVEKVQFPEPGISVSYDRDPVLAASVRRAFLDYADRNDITIAGAHIVFPGIGTIAAKGSGYEWTAAE
jgi:glyoxylase-like metal-dependent hydrolase (beta-lactamase superfamily II)